ncbi:PP2C family protein-serine/threonine phosphatase [Streptomyces sp. NPDC002564]|uniref:PP2C family protein-serine/threonine phosphatase n=1 Tax=Streptomyces sp. NPDC002564 TaxID=3364649 RepID=UPI003691C2BF
MTAPKQADATTRAAPAALAEAWAGAPHPVLVADDGGRVAATNEVGGLLLPRATHGMPLAEAVPKWLADAHARLVDDGSRLALPAQTRREPDVVRGGIGERSFEARPARLDDRHWAWWLAEDTHRRAAEDELRAERRRTALLADVSQQLLASLNVERCMEVTATMAAGHLCDAALVIAPGRGNVYPVTFTGPAGEVTHTTLTVDLAEVPGLSEAMQGFPPVPSRWIDPSVLPEWAVPAHFTGPVCSVVITPLPGHGVPAGVLMLLRSTDRSAFTEAEELFARIFAARAGAAVSAARLYAEQSSISRTLMRDLLPPTLHAVHGVEFAGGYIAAGPDERIGGDFYDVHAGQSSEDETLAVLGDVCGKGLEAAALTGKIRNTVQALRSMGDDHQRLLGLLNESLLQNEHTRFATLALASVVRRGNGVDLRVTSAGHPQPLIARADGTVTEAETKGTLIGALPDVTSTTAHIRLKPGEVCLLFSDGILEATGGPMGTEMFGQERLSRALSECFGMVAEAVVERVQMLATQWVGRGAHDDMAVVAIAVPRHQHLSAVDGHTRGRYTG